jgi:hypothetical protein
LAYPNNEIQFNDLQTRIGRKCSAAFKIHSSILKAICGMGRKTSEIPYEERQKSSRISRIKSRIKKSSIAFIREEKFFFLIKKLPRNTCVLKMRSEGLMIKQNSTLSSWTLVEMEWNL